MTVDLGVMADVLPDGIVVTDRPLSPALLRAGRLVSPLVRELRETRYQFSEDFVMDSGAAEAHFHLAATPWAEVLAATLETYGWKPGTGGSVGAARRSWRRRALLVGGVVQVVIGAWWLVQGLSPVGPRPVAVAAGLPLALHAAGAGRLALPALVASIGALLLWLHRELATPYHRQAGAWLLALAAGGVGLAGVAQTVAVDPLAAGIVATTGLLGLRWLGKEAAVAERHRGASGRSSPRPGPVADQPAATST